MANNELYHYGVLGMKWGVRRSEAKVTRVRKKSQRKNWSEDATTAREIKTKKVSQMSNAELRKLNERKQLEGQYKQLNPSSFKKGVAFIAGATAVMTTAVGLYKASNTTIQVGKEAGNKIIDAIGDWVMSDIGKHING